MEELGRGGGMDVGMEAAVEGVTGKGGDVADDDELHAGSGHGYVHST